MLEASDVVGGVGGFKDTSDEQLRTENAKISYLALEFFSQR